MSNSSNIKEMLDDYEKIKKELEELKKKTAETNLACMKIEKKKNVRTCPICCQPPEVPVCLNGKPRICDLTEPCSASQANPGCLRCVRNYIQYAVDDDKKEIKCFAGCHIINLDRPKKWQIYGEMGRNGNDHPCNSLARALDDVGEGVTKCRKCDEECGSVYNLGMHIKNKCSHRQTKCELCKKKMKMYELEKHREECYRVCSWCDEHNGVETKPIVLKNGTTDHYCPYKTLAKCRSCQKPITMNNIQQHKDCSLTKKGDLGVVCRPEGWKHNFKEHIGWTTNTNNIQDLAVWEQVNHSEFHRLYDTSKQQNSQQVYDVVDRCFRDDDFLPPFTNLSTMTANNEPRYYTYSQIDDIIQSRNNFNGEYRTISRHIQPISQVYFENVN
jgi:hypothetical protein